MKKILLLALVGAFTSATVSAQMLPPEAIIKCTATKNVQAFMEVVKKTWLTPWGNNNWAPSKAVRSSYNMATRDNAPCETFAGWDKVTAGRFLAVKNFENKMVQVDLSGLEKPDVDSMRKYVSENGFKKGYTTSLETWENNDVVVEIPNKWDTRYLKISVYAKLAK